MKTLVPPSVLVFLTSIAGLLLGWTAGFTMISALWVVVAFILMLLHKQSDESKELYFTMFACAFILMAFSNADRNGYYALVVVWGITAIIGMYKQQKMAGEQDV